MLMALFYCRPVRAQYVNDVVVRCNSDQSEHSMLMALLSRCNSDQSEHSMLMAMFSCRPIRAQYVNGDVFLQTNQSAA